MKTKNIPSQYINHSDIYFDWILSRFIRKEKEIFFLMVEYGKKRLVRSSLSLLKNFRFYFQFYYNSASANQLEQIVESFFTPFYRHEKKWFNHCDLYTEDRIAHLYSLPFSYHFKKSISILPNNMKENIYVYYKVIHIERNIHKI